MSLINDALKRTKAVQAQTPPPPPSHLPLRPVDPQVAVMHGVGLALPVALAAVALLILFFAWRFYQDRGAGTKPQLVVAAHSDPALTRAAEPAPTATAVVPIAAKPVAEPTNASPQPTPAPPPPTVTNEPPKPPSEPTPANTNLAAAAEPPVAKPAPLKLQGVVYSRTRPSAVISGKTVFIGDRVREFRVVAITPDSAILTGGGLTNVLTLSD